MKNVRIPEGFQGDWLGPDRCILKCPRGHVAEAQEATAQESVDLTAKKLMSQAERNGCPDCEKLVVEHIMTT